MPRVLLFAATTGYQTRAFGDAAERLGVDLLFATDRCHQLDDPWQDRAIPVRFHDEIGSIASILEAVRQQPVNGILAVGDRPTVLAAHAAAALGLRGHSVDAAITARNKLATRQYLRTADLPTPWFVPTRISVDARTVATSIGRFPCVIKPVSLSGSRGVIRANNEEELVAAFYRLRSILQAADVRGERNQDHETVVVEEFVPGREFAVEGVMNDGVLHVVAIFDKPDLLDGPFFEETIYVTPSVVTASMQNDIVRTVTRAAAVIGMSHGPIHAECRVNDSGVYMLEVAGRPIGGLCARALRFISGGRGPVSYEEVLLRHALGESSTGWTREPSASGVMMIPIPRRGVLRDVAGLDEARAVPGVFDLRITAKADQVLIPLPEGASCLGFVFARGESSAAVETALRRAHQQLAFAIDPEVPVLQSLHG